jgi:hypothetical protein
MMLVAGGLLSTRGFDAVCEVILDYLVATTPMGMWAVSTVTGDA